MVIAVNKSINIDATPERVWSVIAGTATWPEWMLVVPAVQDGPLDVGSVVAWRDESGAIYLAGRVTEFEEAQRLTLELEDVSWTREAEPGEVTYRLLLSRHGGRTRLEFSLGDLSIDDEAEHWRSAYAESRELEQIKALAERPLP
jgi:uncharacterized protein YndB with AHSA1/START domain